MTWCVSATTYDKYKSWVRTNMKGSGLCHFIYYSHSRFSILLHRCTTSCMIFLTLHTDIILFNHPEGELSCGKVTTRQAEFLADPWTFGVNIPLPPSMAGGDDTKHLHLAPGSEIQRRRAFPHCSVFSTWYCVGDTSFYRQNPIDHHARSWVIKSLQPEWTIWPKCRQV